MITRAEFDHVPTEGERLAWCEWLRHHGIDVAVPGFIEVDYDAYRISWLDSEVTVAQSVRVLQLEARPSPFPGEAHACRATPTRTCPEAYATGCGDRPCARFESEGSTPWTAQHG